MIQNYIKIALRSFRKNKTFFLINTTGLAAAFTVSILLFLNAYYELSYDGFHTEKDKILMVYSKEISADDINYSSTLAAPLKQAFDTELKEEIKYSTRIQDGSTTITFGDKKLDEGLSYVDSDFLKMFSFKLVKGDQKTALNDLRSVVINEKIAKKIFGNKEPLGQLIALNISGKPVQFHVTGIIEDTPANSTIENDLFIRIENSKNYVLNKADWNSKFLNLYVWLNDGVSKSDFEKRTNYLIGKYYKETIDQLKSEGAQPLNGEEVLSLKLLPFEDYHLDYLVGNATPFSAKYPYLLMGLAGLILFIASTNFANLSMAQSFTRAKEVGIRSATGASKIQIMTQFWSESFFICTLGFACGCFLASVLVPEFNAVFGSNIEFSTFLTPQILSYFFPAFLVITAIAGSYPGFLLLKFNSVQILKEKVHANGKTGVFSNAMIISQFSIAVFLISSTIIIWSQIDFLLNKPLGFNKNKVVSIPIDYSNDNLAELLKSNLSNFSQIESVTTTDINLGLGRDGTRNKSKYGFIMEGKTINTSAVSIGYGYFKTLDIKLIKGRDFSTAYPSDKESSVLINESMAKLIGFENPIGKRIPITDSIGMEIIGIVQDYHFESLHHKIDAMTYFLTDDEVVPYVFAKVGRHTSPTEGMNIIKKVYNGLSPKTEFNASYLDENTSKLYNKEKRFSKIVLAASLLSILLSTMGLFAISWISISRRAKEVGIRKILGASFYDLIYLLSKRFLMMVIFSIVLASPICYFLLTKWLNDFVYSYKISFLVFLITGIVAVLIVILTISLQTIKSVFANPVKSLRSE